MSIPRKGSRKIEVDDVVYRWTIRRKASRMQADYEDIPATIAIEKLEGPSSKLIVLTNKAHPQNAFIDRPSGVVPSEVRQWIKQSVALGWNACEGGENVVTVDPNGTVNL